VTTRASMKHPRTGRVLYPKPHQAASTRGRGRLPLVAAAIVVVGIGAAVAATQLGGGPKGTTTGLPHTSDYHSLLVDPGNARELLLGTHQGLYASIDGGRTWKFGALSGEDAMNLARPTGKTIWLAGHNVFKKSVDGGASWSDVRPQGLPSLDIHGFTVNPRDPKTLYAAVAGQGLYRSGDGGGSFAMASSEVGGNVMALAATNDGRLLAGDMQAGLLESRDGGSSWRRTFTGQVMGLAINPSEPERVLATGRGIARSVDGGRSWKVVLELPDGAGPVAWSTSEPRVAYAVGFNRTLYRSSDDGDSWEQVR
jgi:photosystem II stability/assembly factor-like uncharacterized protein